MASLVEELGALKPSQLRKRAKAAGVPEEAMEEAEDAESPTEVLIKLIIAATAELDALKPSQLRKRAKAAGATAETMEEAEDSDSPKDALIAFIIAAEQSGAVAGGGPAMAGAGRRGPAMAGNGRW